MQQVFQNHLPLSNSGQIYNFKQEVLIKDNTIKTFLLLNLLKFYLFLVKTRWVTHSI